MSMEKTDRFNVCMYVYICFKYVDLTLEKSLNSQLFTMFVHI